jgi:hypothetical protein
MQASKKSKQLDNYLGAVKKNIGVKSRFFARLFSIKIAYEAGLKY